MTKQQLFLFLFLFFSEQQQQTKNIPFIPETQAMSL
jgi:hypothetical protein